MKKIIVFYGVFFVTAINVQSQSYKDPGELEFRKYRIGQQVDTTLFKKYADLYFPNYLDGWTMQNVRELPKKYKAYPVAIWKLKGDSSVALTLIGNTILNITISYLTDQEKNKWQSALNEKFGGEAQTKTYQKTHPLQSWVTYWNLITWQKDGKIVQFGNSDLRMPDSPARKEVFWNLVYSDLPKENDIISRFKK